MKQEEQEQEYDMCETIIQQDFIAKKKQNEIMIRIRIQNKC